MQHIIGFLYVFSNKLCILFHRKKRGFNMEEWLRLQFNREKKEIQANAHKVTQRVNFIYGTIARSRVPVLTLNSKEISF